MHTKTATAAVLALVGAADAAEFAEMTASGGNYSIDWNVMNRGCAGKVVYAAQGGADLDLAANQVAEQADQDLITDAFSCFTHAGVKIDRGDVSIKEACFDYIPADLETAASCLVHEGYELSASDNATAVYAFAGDDEGAYRSRRELSGEDGGEGGEGAGGGGGDLAPASTAAGGLQPAIARYCRCAGGSFKYVQVDGENVPLKDAAGNAREDADGNPLYEVEWDEASCPASPTHYVTNWIQLPVKDGAIQYLKKCPDNWQVPVNAPPADKGSYKGYTNKYTFSNVNDDAFNEDDDTTVHTFTNESEDVNEWDGVANAGAIIGFGAFGLGILYVVTMISIDMKKRMAMYDELIADDKQKMESMGLGSKMAEFEVELAARLAGGLQETGVDDQLVTQALELRHEDFAKHM